MKIKSAYKSRPIRFIEHYRHREWKLKIYSISSKKEQVNKEDIELAKSDLEKWLSRSEDYKLCIYSFATLILHEFNEGCFAVLNWWIDENMLQNFVYLKRNNETNFELYSNNGMASCVWELAIWWHERNAWVNHILKNNNHPDWEAYYKDCLNADI